MTAFSEPERADKQVNMAMFEVQYDHCLEDLSINMRNLHQHNQYSYRCYKYLPLNTTQKSCHWNRFYKQAYDMSLPSKHWEPLNQWHRGKSQYLNLKIPYRKQSMGLWYAAWSVRQPILNSSRSAAEHHWHALAVCFVVGHKWTWNVTSKKLHHPAPVHNCSVATISLLTLHLCLAFVGETKDWRRKNNRNLCKSWELL